MNKADRIYLGKVFVDYTEAIEKTQEEIDGTTDMIKAIIEGLDLNDERPQEILTYESRLKHLVLYASSKAITLPELIELGEEYKNISMMDYFALKEQITIKEEVEKFIHTF